MKPSLIIANEKPPPSGNVADETKRIAGAATRQKAPPSWRQRRALSESAGAAGAVSVDMSKDLLELLTVSQNAPDRIESHHRIKDPSSS
jgi:hypothetical protein